MEMTGKLFRTWERETYGNDREVVQNKGTRDIMEMTGKLFRTWERETYENDREVVQNMGTRDIWK